MSGGGRGELDGRGERRVHRAECGEVDLDEGGAVGGGGFLDDGARVGFGGDPGVRESDGGGERGEVGGGEVDAGAAGKWVSCMLRRTP